MNHEQDVSGAISLKDFSLSVMNEREQLRRQLRLADEALALARDRLYQEQIGALRREALLANAVAEKATLKSEASDDRRRDEVHLLVGGIKGEITARIDGLEKTLITAVKQLDTTAGRSTGISSTVATLLTVLPIAAAVAGYLLSKAGGQ